MTIQLKGNALSADGLTIGALFIPPREFAIALTTADSTLKQLSLYVSVDGKTWSKPKTYPFQGSDVVLVHGLVPNCWVKFTSTAVS